MNKESASGVTKLNTALLAILIAIGGWQLNTTRSLELRMQSVEQGTKNRWSSAHQQIWTGKLKQNNPSLSVPDPQETVRSIE